MRERERERVSEYMRERARKYIMLKLTNILYIICKLTLQAKCLVKPHAYVSTRSSQCTIMYNQAHACQQGPLSTRVYIIYAAHSQTHMCLATSSNQKQICSNVLP